MAKNEYTTAVYRKTMIITITQRLNNIHLTDTS